MAGGDELLSKGLQGGDLLLLWANRGVRPRRAGGPSLAQAAGLAQRVAVLGGGARAGAGIGLR